MRNDETPPTKESAHHPNERLHEDYWQSVPNILLNDVRDKRLSPTDVVVFMGFADHARGKDNCFVSNRTVAKLLGYSTKTIERSVKSLAKAGRVERSDEKTKVGTKTTRLLVRVWKNGVVREKPSRRHETQDEGNEMGKAKTFSDKANQSLPQLILPPFENPAEDEQANALNQLEDENCVAGYPDDECTDVAF